MWADQTKIGMPIGYSNSRLKEYIHGLNDSFIVLNLNVPKVVIDIILSYLDEIQVPRLHIMSSTHYAQININYLIDQYWDGV